MKHLFRHSCVCLSILACAAFAQTTPAPATAPPATSPTVTGPSKVGILNIQEAIETTGEGKKLEAALSARFAPKSAEIAAAQKEIATLQNQLNSGSNTMSDATKADLQRQIQTKQRDAQQVADNAQTDYQAAQADIMNTVGAKMMEILKKYAEEHGYTAIIDVSLPWPQSPVLYFNPGTVVTSDIVKLYDAAHPVAATTAKP
ncbi:MAG TPA: OmpH family outer membrane protein [Terriglobales bacterium]|nr:OmpH family outer membrane protein [Terriglobales bacterium]